MENKIIIRNIKADDDKIVASIIRQSLEEFGAAKAGTVYFDETTDHLFKLFTAKNSAYFIAEVNGKVSGGAGIFPTEDLPPKTCELVKMYVSAEARGSGLGKMLLKKCEEEAIKNGFISIYIETMPELINAIAMYEKNKFLYIKKPLGNSGHCGCSVFMIKNL